MTDTAATAQDYKDQGNQHFTQQKWQDAVNAYTSAIELNHPDKHACYGNRSAANLKLGNTTAAVADANCAIDAKPTWWKAYSRLGAALQIRKEWGDAEKAYKDGLQKVSAGQSNLTRQLKDCQTRRAGGGGLKSRVPMLVSIQSYLRYFIVINAVLYMLPFVNVGNNFQSVLLSCIVKYMITLSTHGRPAFSAEYGVKVIRDLSLHYLFLSFIMLMMGKPNVLVLFPLVSPDVYLLAGEMYKETPNIARTLSTPMKAIAKLLYGTDDYHQLATQILAFNCMAEIGLGVIHIFEIMTPQRNIIGTVILWQFIRTRHMLMDDMKQAFARLNGAITGYIGNIPVIGGIWKVIVKFASWVSKTPDVNAASSGSSRCTVM